MTFIKMQSFYIRYWKWWPKSYQAWTRFF